MTSDVNSDATPGTTRRPVVAPFGALLLAVLSFSLLQTMPVPALPDLQREFDAGPATVAWLLSAFLLTASVATVLLGRVGDIVGKRKVLLACLGVAAAGTLLAALAGSIEVLIVARAIQGVGAATFPLAFGLAREVFAPAQVPVAIGWISSIFGVGFGVGLVIPGPIVDSLGWPWIFWLMLAVTLLGVVAVAVALPESAIRASASVDWGGGVLLAGGLVAVLLATSEGRSWGWASPATVGLFVLGAVLLVVFGVLQSRLPHPLLDIGLLGRRAVLTANVTALLIGIGMYGAFTLVPQLVETSPQAGYGFGATIGEAGWFIIPMAATMLVASPVAGRLGSRIGFVPVLVLACVIGAAGFVFFAAAATSAWPVYVGSAVLGVGVGFGFASLANLVISAVEPSRTGEATGINTIMRTVGGAVGAQLAATIVAAHTPAGGRTPELSGYTTAFVVSAAALGIAALVAFAGARRGVRSDSPIPIER
ncbi:MFS transporter [Pseudonocardia endophytica]|uniref:EmrB/QacA subfamily drug resistance transporter n=1 Tax=Pseudonocardia endophytica TaxID=401976 RepID=A0A4R1HNC3_PSEEN|nr:MFS transporter [Pseudonocardia endophytica]TCK22095.1 EmrB/QacA subfamily drug resistance transporter [Pseudonocardia endophytica]